ncbi:MAG: Asp-tRNA(Asn)/Glu-tRNA(Gln) amidotransferase subunit GatC [Heliobacteriaceae bacterium]|nr:Asp-tRNA(Asn)/Glu-tRNA(Gln) amidotransferase subunit GatC [Heliobacteriaceae bacterium]MDD4588045.1 Asp-tRNA(Asn)/Glu-tRNA(Gln) amidotransferase subunit GatC [Heliobacteriaceae bacterium]
MALSIARVEQVAMLAQLALTEAEREQVTGQLNAVLAEADRLQALDTTGVPPMIYGLPLRNVFREDGVEPSMAREQILANAPVAEDGFFRVPRILLDD